MPRLLALTVSLTLIGFGMAAQSIEPYTVKVVTKSGNRVKGTLEDVTSDYLYVDRANAGPHRHREEIPLAVVRKLTIRQNRRKNTLEGAIVGGGLAGFLIIQANKKSGFRSPVLYGVNLVMGVAAGAAAGILISHGISSLSAKTIRPPRSGVADEINESLRRQLEPFTYTYQNDVLNRVP